MSVYEQIYDMSGTEYNQSAAGAGGLGIIRGNKSRRNYLHIFTYITTLWRPKQFTDKN